MEEYELKNSEKKTKTEKIVLIIVIVIIIGLMIIAFLNNNELDKVESNIDLNEEYYNGISYEEFQNLSYKEKEKVNKEKFNEQKNNLLITTQGLDINGNLMILMENNNDVPVYDLNMYTIFYDGENKPISITQKRIYLIDEASKNYFTIDKTPENFERYDFLITNENYSSSNYISHKKDISFESYKNEDDRITIKGKNNSSSEINYIIFSIIYYDSSDKIIAIEEVIEYGLDKNKKFETYDYSLYKDDTYEKVEYSRYEVVLNSAYSY